MGRGMRVGRQERRQATAVHAACRRGIDCRYGAGHGEERTSNMPLMSVTLEVSKLSGWLNTDAYCRGSNGGHAVRGEVHRLAGERGGGQLRCTQRAGEGSTVDMGQGTGSSAP